MIGPALIFDNLFSLYRINYFDEGRIRFSISHGGVRAILVVNPRLQVGDILPVKSWQLVLHGLVHHLLIYYEGVVEWFVQGPIEILLAIDLQKGTLLKLFDFIH